MAAWTKLQTASTGGGTTEPSEFAGQEVRYFGDSITAGTNGGFVQYIDSALGVTGINHGSSGAATDRLVGLMTPMRDRATYTFTEAIPDYTNTTALTLMIGTNGGVTGTISDIPSSTTIQVGIDKIPFTYNSVLIDTEAKYWALFANTFYGNIGLCLEYVKWKNNKTRIFLISPPHSDRGNWLQSPAIRNAMIEIGAFYSVTVIDAQQNAGLDKKMLYRYSYDNTHLLPLGNELFGKYIGKQIKYS